VCLAGESNRSIREGVGKPTWPQRWGFTPTVRAAVFKRGEPVGHDPEPDDLHVGKVKHGESHVEACQGWCLSIPSRDLRVGVKGPSSPATAGSDRNMSKHDLSRGSPWGRATDWGVRLREESALLSNSEPTDAADAGNPVCGVSLCTVRERTLS
jgi:hypothetical protein